MRVDGRGCRIIGGGVDDAGVDRFVVMVAERGGEGGAVVDAEEGEGHDEGEEERGEDLSAHSL